MSVPFAAVLIDVPGADSMERRLGESGVPAAVLSDAGMASLLEPARFEAFRGAAADLGVPIERCVAVVADVVGARAASRAGVSSVVGIADVTGRAALEAAGAHRVLDDIGELDLGGLGTDPWQLIYRGFDPDHEGHREALTVVGNGYVAVRGAQAERRADAIHYPGTYLAGVNDRAAALLHGRTVHEEQLVNLPNWLCFDVRVGTGLWWSEQPETAARSESHRLDLRHGVRTRSAVISGAGGSLRVTQTTFVSMRDRHVMVQESLVESLGWTGPVAVRTGIDADVRNGNAGAPARHLTTAHFALRADDLLCEVATEHSRIDIALAMRHATSGEVRERRWLDSGGSRLLHLEAIVSRASPLKIVKTVAIASSRDPGLTTAGSAALRHLDAVAPESVRDRHEAAWRRLWDRYGIGLEADAQSQAAVNLHVFQVLQAVSAHTPPDAGIPARGLHGEGYLGHVFWDELFVFPVLGPREPETARTLLDYRWNRLDAARRAARDAGLPGARYPWQSGSDGTEQTPPVLFNPRSGRWMPDHSALQLHVGLAVAYNAWQYYELTDDVSWLADRGGELIIEIVRHFTALAQYDGTDQRFHIDGVMGPDEYHDGPPGAPGTGLRDNAYTNVMTAWVCRRALDVFDHLRGHFAADLASRMGVTVEERSHWSRVGARMFVPFLAGGVISQFDGYDRLVEFDWDGYRARYGNIERLDLILEAEGDTTNRYKLAKQADVLMLVYVLGADALSELLNELGYAADLPATLDYYLPRTANGSTLSRVVTASVLAHVRAAESWGIFREALDADLDDTQGGTTRQGIHLGAMAGTIDLIVRGYAGLRPRGDELRFTPRLPAELRATSFRLRYRGHALRIRLDHSSLTIRARPSVAAPIKVTVNGSTHELGAGHELEHRLD